MLTKENKHMTQEDKKTERFGLGLDFGQTT